MKTGAVLFGLAQLLRLRAATDGDFRALLARRDAVFYVGLADGSEGRSFAARGGKLASRAGRHPSPDAALLCTSAAAASTILTIRPDYLGRIEAAESFQLRMEGSE